ncbi:MAG: DNA topoisomerase [Clostridia bacterium]|nr:DNA topoisomerase [Clostridia bacterium]
MPQKQVYDNDSISSLKGADRVRLRPGVIFGSDDIVGAQHAFFEILSNSIDEAREGYGNEIVIKRYKDHSIEISDKGRGIPLDFNRKEGRYNWELVYCELYAGGKYNTLEGENYEYSLGLNGLGACATQYASEFFDVEVCRDGTVFQLHFEKGENIGGLKKSPAPKQRSTGTTQRWKPDRQVFTEVEIPVEYFVNVLKRQAIVNAGVTFHFEDEVSGEDLTFLYPDGVLGFVREVNNDVGISTPKSWLAEGSGSDRKDRPNYKLRVELAFCFNNENPLQEYYHNSSWLEHGGSPEKAVRLGFTAALDKLIKQRDKYKANETHITWQDVSDSLICVVNSFSTQTSYENQTKKAINNRFIQNFISELIRERLEVWAIEQQQEADRVLDQMLINKRSRESAEKQRITVKRSLMGSLDINNRVKNFVDCRSREVGRRELYIVEGNSALGSVKMGRNAEFQAVIPIRGKILNCLKADLNQIFKSDIITDLMKVIGTGVEVTNRNNKQIAPFDLEQLRWNKIIICTDADVDGFQIRTLLLAMFFRMTPTLLREGKIFIAESPLYEITYKKGKDEKTLFAFDDKEKTAVLQEYGARYCHLQRSKGLGENEPEMMWETTMNPETRRLIQVQAEDQQKMQEVFDLLLGDNLSGRKQHIEDNGHLYLDMLDVD